MLENTFVMSTLALPEVDARWGVPKIASVTFVTKTFQMVATWGYILLARRRNPDVGRALGLSCDARRATAVGMIVSCGLWPLSAGRGAGPTLSPFAGGVVGEDTVVPSRALSVLLPLKALTDCLAGIPGGWFGRWRSSFACRSTVSACVIQSVPMLFLSFVGELDVHRSLQFIVVSGFDLMVDFGVV